MANFLSRELGIGRGDRVACLSFNRAEYIILFFALGRLGAILVPLNFRLAPAEFVYFLEDAAPKAIFFDRDHRDRVNEFKSNVALDHYVCFDDDDTPGSTPVKSWQTLPADQPPGSRSNPMIPS